MFILYIVAVVLVALLVLLSNQLRHLRWAQLLTVDLSRGLLTKVLLFPQVQTISADIEFFCRLAWVLPPWITNSTAWRLNTSLYLRAILLFFTIALILLCAPVSAKSGRFILTRSRIRNQSIELAQI